MPMTAAEGGAVDRFKVWSVVAVAGLLCVGVGVGAAVRSRSGPEPVATQTTGAAALAGFEVIGDLTGRLHGYPYMTAENDQLVVYSGADHAEDEPSASFLVSSAGGRDLRRVAASLPVGRMGVVIGDDGIYVMGQRCAEPDRPDDDCDPNVKDVVSYRIDPDTLAVHPIDPPPLEGEVSDAIRLKDGRPAFVVTTRRGPVEDEDVTSRLVAWSGEGWRMSSLPADTFRVCSAEGVTIAVAPELSAHRELDEPVMKGEVIWKAFVSDDGGATWSDPIPYRSRLPHDSSTSPATSCGSRGVAVMSTQLSVLDIDSREGTAVDLAKADRPDPGTSAIWNGDGALSFWVTVARPDATEPNGLSSRRHQVVVSDVWGRPVARADEPDPSIDAVESGRGPGSDRDGFAVMYREDRVTLVRLDRESRHGRWCPPAEGMAGRPSSAAYGDCAGGFEPRGSSDRYVAAHRARRKDPSTCSTIVFAAAPPPSSVP
jgi:hypothetical protein